MPVGTLGPPYEKGHSAVEAGLPSKTTSFGHCLMRYATPYRAEARFSRGSDATVTLWPQIVWYLKGPLFHETPEKDVSADV